MSDQEIFPPDGAELLHKISTALVQVSRGDPLIAFRNEVSSRFAAIDKATELQHDDLVRVPTQVDKAIVALRELVDQKIATAMAEVLGEHRKHVAETQQRFTGTDNQFKERDTRTDQRAGDTKLAVDAAFAAAKEATAKIEAGFTKQIDGIRDLVETQTGNLSSSIGDLKDRLIAIESRTSGQSQGISSIGALVLGGCSVLMVLLSFATILMLVFKH